MSVRGLMRTAMWTQLRDALVKDFDGIDIPANAPPETHKFIVEYVDILAEKNEDRK